MFTYGDKQVLARIINKVKNDGVSRTETELFAAVIEEWEKCQSSDLELDDDEDYSNAFKSVANDNDL